MDKPPITEENYLHGVKVVDIGDLRVSRGKTRRPSSVCRHRKQVYDVTERRVWCSDCEQEIEPFDAYKILIEQYNKAVESLLKRQEEVKQAETFAIRRRATKALDEVWRGKMLPCCVNCGMGMLPEDYVNVTRVGRDYGQ